MSEITYETDDLGPCCSMDFSVGMVNGSPRLFDVPCGGPVETTVVLDGETYDACQSCAGYLNTVKVT